MKAIAKRYESMSRLGKRFLDVFLIMLVSFVSMVNMVLVMLDNMGSYGYAQPYAHRPDFWFFFAVSMVTVLLAIGMTPNPKDAARWES